MKKINVKKGTLKEIQKHLKRSEVAFDSFLTSIEACLLEEDWRRIHRFEKLILKSKAKIAKILQQSKTMSKKVM